MIMLTVASVAVSALTLTKLLGPKLGCPSSDDRLVALLQADPFWNETSRGATEIDRTSKRPCDNEERVAVVRRTYRAGDRSESMSSFYLEAAKRSGWDFRGYSKHGLACFAKQDLGRDRELVIDMPAQGRLAADEPITLEMNTFRFRYGPCPGGKVSSTP